MSNPPRPQLPATGRARIALARTTIEQVIEHQDATLTGERPSGAGLYPGCQCFTLRAGSFELGVALNKQIATALEAVGFGSDTVPTCTYGSPVGGPGQKHVGLYFHVPVTP